MRSEKRPNTRMQMIDIARMAGVSVSTVSRALAGSDLVNDATRKKIVDLAKSLRFSANVGAQNLRRGQSQTIAVVLPKSNADQQPVSDPFFISLLGELADALTSRGYDMLLTRVNEDHIDDVEGLVVSGRALGIVVIGQWLHHYVLTGLAARGVPIAVWGATLPGSNYFTVGGDNRLGGKLATEHLIACGRRRIMFLGDTRLPEVALRFEGYRDALIGAGYLVNPGLTAAVPFEGKAARRSLEDLFDHTADFDALFACSDLIAMTANGLLNARGLRVPDDVCVVGYDDLSLASQVHPTLTSVRQPLAAAAQALVDAVLAAREGKAPALVVLETTLIQRESSQLAASGVNKPKVAARSAKSAKGTKGAKR
ncbi:MAG: LacI family transcriptional regulator [Burkholderiales bacterium]|nr:MAG: LacI family transcriptional regulator [Burkholderiales bacterium]TAG82365.1 MAG: LacI family transcriptional regulator [Betaproteobacteria bacterium]